MEANERPLKLLSTALIVGGFAVMKHFGYFPNLTLKSPESGKATYIQRMGDNNINSKQIIGDNNRLK